MDLFRVVNLSAKVCVFYPDFYLSLKNFVLKNRKNKQLDIVRDKMDGIEMKRLLRQNSQEQSSHKQKCPDIQIVDLSLENDNPEKEKMISSNRSITQIDSNKRISLKSLDGLPR